MSALRRLAPLTLLALAVAAAIVLLDRRPPWPHLPAALDLPVTTTFVQRILLTAAWAALLLLLAIVAARAARAARPQPRGLTPTPARRPVRSTSLSRRAPRSVPLRVARPPEPAATSIGSLSLKLDLQIPATTTAATNAGPPDGSEAVSEVQAPEAASEPATPMRLRLLGPLEIEGAPMPRRTSTRELIAFLAFTPNGATRDQLLEALWPDADPRRSRPRLWQSTAEARRILGDTFLRDDDDRYRLDRSRLWIDTDELARQLDHMSATDDPGALDRALALWRGEPLDGSDYAWADTHVRQLRGTQIDLLTRAGTARLTAGDAHDALQAAERGIAIDQLHEPCWRLALQAEAALGLRDAVTTRYERLASLLDERLGLRPEAATTSLYRDLLAA